ncbi:hypothetical protein ACWCQW_10450 [Streptomyces mirabilis]
MNYGSLAATGAAISIGGIVLDQTWLVGIAAGLIVAGAFAIRFGFRRNKTMQDI